MRAPDERIGSPEARVVAFRELYEANFSAVLGYAVRRLASSDDAADVVAETFLTAWRRLDSVPGGEQTRPWLYGVARRVLANHRRAEARRTHLAGRLRDDIAALLPPSLAEGEELGAVVAAFNALGPGDREVLALVAWEELGMAELGGVLDCSRNAAKIRLHRARRRFDRELARLQANTATEQTGGRVALANVATSREDGR